MHTCMHRDKVNGDRMGTISKYFFAWAQSPLRYELIPCLDGCEIWKNVSALAYNGEGYYRVGRQLHAGRAGRGPVPRSQLHVRDAGV